MYSAPARILSVGTSLPQNRYTQKEILELFHVENPIVRRIFQASHIEGRHLYLPEPDENGVPNESQSQLLSKHRKGAMELGRAAVEKALDRSGLKASEIDMLCCISSSGFMLPGLTAMFVRHFGFRTDCHRMDLLGMGCNAGLNGLNPVTAWARANPGKTAMMVCCEINSALYVFDNKVGTGVVNSLFGDGCAAVVIRAQVQDSPLLLPEILFFSSHLIPETWRAMSYHWSEEHGKFYFNLDRDVPYVLGAHADQPIAKLLAPFGLQIRDVSHWIVHSGGKKVLDALKYTLGITAHDIRHTVSLLRDCGNLGSGSFLFAYERLLKEGKVKAGDYGVMMTMGPGSTIETALLKW
ncbi:MAG: type III polyketide synthase [Proteobacteria bacterium]|nr:type III polyketide synthase [Pseudomonadota bacterium]